MPVRPAGDRSDLVLEREAITHAARRLPSLHREVPGCRFLLDLSVAETTLCSHPCNERLVPGLTRVARTLPDGRVFLMVWRLDAAQKRVPAGATSSRKSSPTRPDARSSVPPASGQRRSLSGGRLPVCPPPALRPPGRSGPRLFPDGVSWVRWTFVCSRARPCRPGDSKPVSVDAPVLNNVAVARVPGTGRDARGAGRAEWYGRDGRLLANFTSPGSPTTPLLQTGHNTRPLQEPVGQASPRQILAFLAEAHHAIAGAFTLKYAIEIRYPNGVVRHLVVTAAQSSPNLFVYRETPSLLLTRAGGPPASHGYEVFEAARGLASAGPGLYSCAQPLPTSSWSCHGPYTGIGMGGINQLLGPYPPQALVLGLDNATETFVGLPTPPATQPEPAFLFTHGRSTERLRCLRFGRLADPAGSVCLLPNGIIASYELPQSAYRRATLLAYSSHVPGHTFTLPAKPTSP